MWVWPEIDHFFLRVVGQFVVSEHRDSFKFAEVVRHDWYSVLVSESYWKIKISIIFTLIDLAGVAQRFKFQSLEQCLPVVAYLFLVSFFFYGNKSF